MALDLRTITQILYRKSDPELATITADAEQVALGAMSSVSALSQSATFSSEDASVILQAAESVRRARENNPDASGSDLPGTTLGHAMRFQPIQPPQGCTWGP
jgi:hypothetical protein